MFSNYNLLPKILIPAIATVLIWALSENVFERTQDQEITDCD